jgi:hypothetical protein|tara:strand:+ start:961 stop:1188 length:228 start_codon:yes stop_codon:yes gene_type:complete
MYSIILATMLATGEPSIPLIVSSYSTLNNCRFELIRIGKSRGYELVNNPIVGYAVVRVEDDKTTTAFCVKNIQSI